MANPERFPGSREEDAWLSDEQLERCEPAEQEPFQGPVPTRMISNGEYMPFPQTEKQKHVEARVKELADKDKSDVDKLRDQVTQLTKERDEQAARVVRHEVALSKGLNAAQAKRLVGDTKEEHNDRTTLQSWYRWIGAGKGLGGSRPCTSAACAIR